MIYGDSGIVRRNAKKSPEAVEHLNSSHPLCEHSARGDREERIIQRNMIFCGRNFLPFDLLVYLVFKNENDHFQSKRA